MNSEITSHLPKVHVVTLNPDHRTFFEGALSPYFLLTIYRDVDEAIEE
jgi:hypothetical protein